ncbi:hypothetical protein [Thiolinea disciformis]|uniref:hypothetical protein n=1 Tax=Thiolinea disciformis TaxID=125614 RepID=UPI00036FF466|nr:hypothetical protein [Thiolinea disciformis]
MSTETNPVPATESFTLRYQQPSDFHQDAVELFTHLERDAVQFAGKVKQPIAFREGLATLFAVVSSDYRYVPKDRAAYTAFMQMRRSSQNQGLAKAYRAYFDWLLRNDPQAWLILDPIISVHPDGLLLEVFSKDEGCYAALALDNAFFETQGQTQFGTTHIDFSQELAQGIEQIRSFRDTHFTVGKDAVNFKTETAPALPDTEVIEKRIQVPHTWIRGLLQVQSASQLPSDTFFLKPIDLYNALRHLRLHADIKGKKRGLRIELVPNQPPRLVLEPKDVVIEGSAEPYQGKQAKVIRLWGRRRLSLLKRFLPFAETIEVQVLGNGMPSFWILSGAGMSLTLAVTGFTASNWSQALNFDLLLPRRTETLKELKTVVAALQKTYVATLEDLAADTQLSEQVCRTALQQASQQGLVIYDLAHDVYRYRPLTQEPLDMAHFQFRHSAEKLAYDLVARQKAIRPLQLNVIPLEGTEIAADITVKEDKRDYLAKLKLTEEGQISKASCSCHQIMTHGLSQGACSHLIALRITYAQQQANRNLSIITHETRLLTRRHKQQQEQIQVTLNQKRLLISRELNQQNKQQQFAFNSVQEARHAYLGKIAQLELSGFIEG